jgi:hypothetical protein
MRTPPTLLRHAFLLTCALALPIAALAQNTASPAPGLGAAPNAVGASG